MTVSPRSDHDTEVTRLRAALRRDPENAALHNDLANRLLALGRNGEALTRYRTALRFAPGSAVLHFNLANALAAAGQSDPALDSYHRALAVAPDFAAAHNNLGNLLRKLGRPLPATDAYRRAVYLTPADPALRYNLGTALLDLDRATEALALFEQATAADPPHVPGFASAGEALLRLGRRREAEAAFRIALALRPDDQAARMGAAVCRLAAGDFPAGWPGFEARLDNPFIRAGLPALPGQRLRPEDLGCVAGKHIVVMAEQGFGDTIQFARYAPLLRARGARVTLLVPPALVRLLEGVADVVLAADRRPARWDFLCPMMSLPWVFGTTEETIPAAADLDGAAWPFPLPAGGRRLGLAWSGNPGHRLDAERSLPAAALAPLLAVPGWAFHALHREIRPDDLPLPDAIIGHEAALTDFAATAGLIAGLDLVIAVDTAVAHLAGAMAKPVWLLLAANADWRWQERRADTPWYPTARLYRQDGGGWPAVIARVAADLADWR